MNQLGGPLLLRGRKWVPTQAVIYRSHDVTLLGITSTNLNRSVVRLRAQGASVDEGRQEIARVEIKQNRTIRLGITGGLVNVHLQILRRWWQTLQRRKDRDVFTINNVRGNSDIVKDLI